MPAVCKCTEKTVVSSGIPVHVLALTHCCLKEVFIEEKWAMVQRQLKFVHTIQSLVSMDAHHRAVSFFFGRSLAKPTTYCRCSRFADKD